MKGPVTSVLHRAPIGAALLCAGLALMIGMSAWRDGVAPHLWAQLKPVITGHTANTGNDSSGAQTASRPATSLDSLRQLRQRWDAAWSTDISAAELNVAHLHHAEALIERAERGDLDATVDLVGAATWCLAAGPLATITDPVGDDQRACFERFGVDIASRERLERAAFRWVLRLAAAGVEDATLYASALTRGIGPDLPGGLDRDSDTRDMQRALLIGQLQTLAERGSADAASELHGHWSGNSSFHLNDEQAAYYYAKLTEKLDPERSLALVAQ